MYCPNLTQEQLKMMFDKTTSFKEPFVGDIHISLDTKFIGLNELIPPEVISYVPPIDQQRCYPRGFNITISFTNGHETATLARTYDKISEELFYSYAASQSLMELSVYALNTKTYSFTATDERFGVFIRMLLSE